MTVLLLLTVPTTRSCRLEPKPMGQAAGRQVGAGVEQVAGAVGVEVEGASSSASQNWSPRCSGPARGSPGAGQAEGVGGLTRTFTLTSPIFSAVAGGGAHPPGSRATASGAGDVQVGDAVDA